MEMYLIHHVHKKLLDTQQSKRMYIISQIPTELVGIYWKFKYREERVVHDPASGRCEGLSYA